MKIKIATVISLFAALANVGCADVQSADVDSGAPRIAWFGTLEAGLAEAKQSGRPILLVSAAPQCLGVPGIW